VSPTPVVLADPPSRVSGTKHTHYPSRNSGEHVALDEAPLATYNATLRLSEWAVVYEAPAIFSLRRRVVL
jgi:hypothetical protein